MQISHSPPIKKFFAFMECELPSPCLQQLMTGPILCHGSSLHPVCFKIHVNIILLLIPISAGGIVFTVHWCRQLIRN